MKDKLEKFDRDLTLKAWNDSLPLGNLNSELYNHWKKYVPIIYDPEFDYNNPTQLINNEIYAKDILFSPMEHFLCGGEPTQVFASLKASDTTPNVCGKVFKTGQPTYTCLDCAMDGTCVLCSECFLQSPHKIHRYKIFTSSGGGICDCGDIEAWNSEPYCNIHKPNNPKISSDGNKESIASTINDTSLALDNLPSDMVDRAGSLLMSTIQYTVLMLTWQDPHNVPDLLRTKPPNNNFVTMLFNDEMHTYEQVINTLCRAIECSHKEAVDFAGTVDREGRSPVLIGSSSDCERVRGTIERATSRHGSKSLKVLVFQSNVVAHQTFASKLLLWINYVIGHSDGLRVLLCNLATQPLPDEEHCILEHIILHDTQIWKLARTKAHELFLSNMLMYPETKKKLASLFTQHYARIMDDFIEDDHDHSISVSCLAVQLLTVPTIHYATIAEDYIESEHWYDDSVSDLSVQIFTTPSVARYLMMHKNVLAVVVETFIRVCRPFTNSSGKLSFDRTQHNNTFRRAQYILNDLHYLLNAPPKADEWCDKLRKNFLKGFNSLMNLLSSIQNMDTVIRKTGQHLDFEPEWETAYNLMYKLIPCMTSLEAWVGSDRSILLRCLDRLLRMLHRLDPKLSYHVVHCPSSFKEISEDAMLSYDRSYKAVYFSVSSQPVSVHLPVTRLMAGLYLHLAKYDLCYFSKRNKDLDLSIHTQSSPIIARELLSYPGFAPSRSSLVKESTSALYESEEECNAPIGGALVESNNLISLINDPATYTSKVTIINKDSIKYPTPVELLEYPLRTLVLTAQVQVGMWRRNGYSLLNQVYLYHNSKWRAQMYDRDVLCIQIAGALITADSLSAELSSADAMLVHLLDRYELLDTLIKLEYMWHPCKIFDSPEDEREDFKNKGALYEEFLNLLIVIISERYVLGLGQVSSEEIMEREILHQLCMGPVAHSELVKSLSEDIGKSPELEKILSKIAVLKKSTDIVTKTKYELKDQYFKHYSPFFYHYTKSEQSKAEEFKKSRKCDLLEDRAAPPPPPPQFTEAFESLTKLMSTPLFIRILRVALKCGLLPKDSPRSHFSTDLHVHQALYLMCLALYEDKRQISMGNMKSLFVDFVHTGNLQNPLKALLEENRLEIYSDLIKYTLMLIEEIAEFKKRNSDKKDFILNSVKVTSSEPSSSLTDKIYGPAMETDETSTLTYGENATQTTHTLKGDNKPVKRSNAKSSSDTTCNASPGELHRRKRFEAANARRNKILAQMNEAQKSFIAGNRELWDSIPSATSSTTIPQLNSTSSLDEPALLVQKMDDRFGSRESEKEGTVIEGFDPGAAMELATCDPIMLDNSSDSNLARSKENSRQKPLRVLGPDRMSVEEVAQRYYDSDAELKTFTCILCQEEQRISLTGDALVMAAFVQNSTVACREPGRKVTPEDYALDPAYPRVDLTLGPAALSCGHVMHRDCWQRFYDAVVARERRHALRFRFHHVTFDVERNEFLCPLCQALSNTVLPLLPPLATLATRTPPTDAGAGDEISFVQWLKVVETIVRMSVLTHQPSDDDHTTYKTEWQYLLKTSDLDTILNYLEDEDLSYSEFEELLLPSKHAKDLEISPSILSMLRTFSLTIYTVGLELDPFEDNDRLPVMTWHACAFTYVLAVAGLAHARRPLFASLTARSRDCLSYLARFVGVFGTCVKRELVRHHALRLLTLVFGGLAPSETTTDDKNDDAPCLVLDVDPFCFLVRLCFACPFIFADKNTPNAAVIDCGRTMDYFLLRLMYTVQIIQCLVVYQPSLAATQVVQDDMDTESLEQDEASLLYEFWGEIQMALFKERSSTEQDTFSSNDLTTSFEMESVTLAPPFTSPFNLEKYQANGPEAMALLKHIKISVLPFLRCSALFFHFLTDIPYPEGVLTTVPISPENDSLYFEPLCHYLGLPISFQTLIQSGGRRLKKVIMENWLQHPKMREAFEPNYNGFIIRYPLTPRTLIPLPADYTDLISLAAKFTCPNSDGDESRAPTLCLMCGALLCSQSYCCQTELEIGPGLANGAGVTPVGACTAHAFTCGAGTGIFLRIRECQILFLSGRTKGTFYTPPYIDAYGETDQGLRRGNPLFLCNDRYENLQRIWISNLIPDEIARSLESNPNLLSIDWQHL